MQRGEKALSVGFCRRAGKVMKDGVCFVNKEVYVCGVDKLNAVKVVVSSQPLSRR